MPGTVILSKAAEITLSNLPPKYLCLYPEAWLLSTMEQAAGERCGVRQGAENKRLRAQP